MGEGGSYESNPNCRYFRACPLHRRLLVNALLLFVTLNLYYAAKNEIAVKEVIEKYSVASTVDLLSLMHEPGHSVGMQENRLLIDKGSDHERIFILMREPFFHIIDQGKMMQMTKELPN